MTTEQIKSKTIQFNGVPVTCYSDGSIAVLDNRSNQLVRSFGSVDGTDGRYRARRIGQKLERVHRVIAAAFIGPLVDGFFVDHINGDCKDNRPENLRYATTSQNLRGARRTHGLSKYRGVCLVNESWKVQVLGQYHGLFSDEKEAAEKWDDVAFYRHNFPLEGLNFPQRILDKMAASGTDNSMIDKATDNKSENAERIQTQIEMIRQESRILSYRIERMMEQRKGLSDEKRKLKEQLETLSV